MLWILYKYYAPNRVMLEPEHYWDVKTFPANGTNARLEWHQMIQGYMKQKKSPQF